MLSKKLYLDTDDKFFNDFLSFLPSSIKNQEYELIISFTEANHLKIFFNKAVILRLEAGIYTRKPFPMTLFIDNNGIYKNGLFYSKIDKIKNFKSPFNLIDLIQNKFINKIKTPDYLIKKIEFSKKRFKKTILLALQFEDHYIYQSHAKFKDQFDLLNYVLSNIDKDIGVIVTEHPQFPVLNSRVIKYIKSKYRNFIYIPEFNFVQGSSYHILNFVDAVFTESSTVAFHSLLWKKKLVILGDSFLKVISDFKTIEDYNNSEKYNFPKWKLNVLSWLLFRYSFPFEFLFSDNNFFNLISSLKEKDFLVYDSTTFDRKIFNFYSKYIPDLSDFFLYNLTTLDDLSPKLIEEKFDDGNQGLYQRVVNSYLLQQNFNTLQSAHTDLEQDRDLLQQNFDTLQSAHTDLEQDQDLLQQNYIQAKDNLHYHIESLIKSYDKHLLLTYNLFWLIKRFVYVFIKNIIKMLK